MTCVGSGWWLQESHTQRGQEHEEPWEDLSKRNKHTQEPWTCTCYQTVLRVNALSTASIHTHTHLFSPNMWKQHLTCIKRSLCSRHCLRALCEIKTTDGGSSRPSRVEQTISALEDGAEELTQNSARERGKKKKNGKYEKAITRHGRVWEAPSKKRFQKRSKWWKRLKS